MTKYYVKVTQINEFYIEAKNKKEPEDIAHQDYIWDEDQNYPDTYGYKINVEEVNDQEELHNDAVIDNQYERSRDAWI